MNHSIVLSRYRGLSSVARISIQYAILSFSTHILFILISLVPGWRAEPLIHGDTITYVMDAENIIKNGVFSREQSTPFLWEPYRTPGYPLLLAFSKWISGNFTFTLFLAAIMAGLAAWVAVQAAAMLGCNQKGQHFAGLVMAFLPNSLGLAAFLLTDAIFGYLFVIWIFLLYLGFAYRNKSMLFASGLFLMLLQTIKPTLNLGIVFVLGLGSLLIQDRKDWYRTVLLAGLALVLPFFFSTMNYRDHGIFSSSLLGVQTAREYLQVRFLSEETGREISQVTDQVRYQDRREAKMLAQPESIYGRLYLVERQQVLQFLRLHPVRISWLMLKETIRQFVAPQEFLFVIFKTDPPAWIRLFGSLLTLILWGSAILGALKLAARGSIQPAILLFGSLTFLLVTGSVSHFVGARLRFPADLLAVPFSAYGIFSDPPGDFFTTRDLTEVPGDKAKS
jgi:hypothetical protein